MDMPVEITHGFFREFFIPGLMLIGLGIINEMSVSFLNQFPFSALSSKQKRNCCRPCIFECFVIK
jgi:hypothetical protein